MNRSKLLRLTILTLWNVLFIASFAYGSQKAQNKDVIDVVQTTSLEDREKINELIDGHFEEIQARFDEEKENLGYTVKCLEFDWLPDYLIKLKRSRVSGAKALLKCVEKLKLDLIVIPEQWKYHAPQEYQQSPYSTLVIAKKLETADQHQPINFKQAQQIYTLLKHARYKGFLYSDAHTENLLRCPNGRIGFIDTEKSAWKADNRREALSNLLNQTFKNTFDKDAQEFIEKKLEQCVSKGNQ